MHTHHSYSFFHYHYLHSRQTCFSSIVTSYPYFLHLLALESLTKISISLIEQVFSSQMNFVKEPTDDDDWLEALEKIKVLEKPTNTDYKDWAETLKHFLSAAKVDIALTEDEPTKPTDASSLADKLKHEKWLHSNKICLVTMKRYMDPKMLKYLNALCDIKNAKEFLEAVGERIRLLVIRRNRSKKKDGEKDRIWD